MMYITYRFLSKFYLVLSFTSSGLLCALRCQKVVCKNAPYQNTFKCVHMQSGKGEKMTMEHSVLSLVFTFL